jgi:hypothetical protein
MSNELYTIDKKPQKVTQFINQLQQDYERI